MSDKENKNLIEKAADYVSDCVDGLKGIAKPFVNDFIDYVIDIAKIVSE